MCCYNIACDQRGYCILCRSGWIQSNSTSIRGPKLKTSKFLSFSFQEYFSSTTCSGFVSTCLKPFVIFYWSGPLRSWPGTRFFPVNLVNNEYWSSLWFIWLIILQLIFTLAYCICWLISQNLKHKKSPRKIAVYLSVYTVVFLIPEPLSFSCRNITPFLPQTSPQKT